MCAAPLRALPAERQEAHINECYDQQAAISESIRVAPAHARAAGADDAFEALPALPRRRVAAAPPATATPSE